MPIGTYDGPLVMYGWELAQIQATNTNNLLGYESHRYSLLALFCLTQLYIGYIPYHYCTRKLYINFFLIKLFKKKELKLFPCRLYNQLCSQLPFRIIIHNSYICSSTVLVYMVKGYLTVCGLHESVVLGGGGGGGVAILCTN